MTSARIALWVALCGGALGCGGDDGVSYTWRINPAELCEVNLRLLGADTATVTFTASAPVHWDIHWHDAVRVYYLDQGEAATKTLVVRATPESPLTSAAWLHPAHTLAPITVTAFVTPKKLVDSTFP